MTRTQTGSVIHWTRQVAQLRTQALKAKRVHQSDGGAVADTALETCDGMLRDLAGAFLECDRLRAEVHSGHAAWEHLFQMMPVACLSTDRVGAIVSANRAAGLLLNTSPKHLKDRQLLVFSENRVAFSAILEQRALPQQLRATITLRPRERKRTEADVLIVPLSTDATDLWLWFLTPTRDRRDAAEPVISDYERTEANQLIPQPAAFRG